MKRARLLETCDGAAAELACAFLDERSLCRTSACSRSTKTIARKIHLWDALTTRRFPEAELLRTTVGGASAVVGLAAFTRMRRLWRGNGGHDVDAPPGIEAYSALVVVKSDDGRAENPVVEGLFDLECKTPVHWLIPEEIRIVLPDAAVRSMTDVNLKHRLEISVSLVRKNDGRCLHLFTAAAIKEIHPNWVKFEDARWKSAFPSFTAGMAGRERYGPWRCAPYYSLDFDGYHFRETEEGTFMTALDGFVLRLHEHSHVQCFKFRSMSCERQLELWHVSPDWV